MDEFFKGLWWVVSRLPRTLLWVALWVAWWAPWGDSGRGPVDSALFVLIGLVFMTGALVLLGVVIRPARALMWLVTPLGDFRSMARRSGGLMGTVTQGFGLVDPASGKRLPRVQVTADRQAGEYSVAWPTGIRPDTPEHLDRLALGLYAHLGACRHSVVTTKGRWVVTWHRDPLPDALAGIRHSGTGTGDLAPVVVGRRADGGDAAIDLTDASHVAVQGMTRSGKSAFLYTLLSPLAPAVRSGSVVLAGIDPNRVLLGPWRSLTSPDLLALGTDAQQAARVMGEYVAELDRRLEWIDAQGVEAVKSFDQTMPLFVVVLEEYPGLLEALGDYDRDQKPADRLTGRVKGGVSRLVSEGAKAGMRVVLISQRADADVIGGRQRSQFGTRITFAVDNGDAVRMLHPATDPETVEAVTRFNPGRCLFWQHRVETVVQADLTEYPVYRDRLGAPAPAASESPAG